MRTKIGKMFSISEWIRLYKAGTRTGQMLKKYDVLYFWPDIMGSAIASVSTAEKLEGQTLHIRVSNPVWRQELHFRKLEIIGKINTFFGDKIVKDIIFR